MTTQSVIPPELAHPTAEMTVLAALTSNMDLAIELAQVIDPSDFSSPLGQVVAEAALRVLRGIEPLDTMNLLAACRDIADERRIPLKVTEEMLAGFQQGNSSRAAAYAVTVKRFAWLRRAREFADWFRTEVNNLGDPDELFTAAQEHIQHLHPDSKAATWVYGWDTIKEHDKMLRERIRQFEDGGQVVFDWPWATWNRAIRPLRAGMVGIVAAADGTGKSSVLEMVAEHWATKSNVVFVHCENDFDFTMNRRLTRHSDVPMAAIEDGDLTQDQRATIAETNRSLAERFSSSLHYLDAAGWTSSELVNELTMRHSEGVCDAVVLDYINKLRPSREQIRLYGHDVLSRQADDMEQLKTWAIRHGAPLMTAAQLTKMGKTASGRKTRSDMRATGEWSDKVQLVILMSREILDKELKNARGEVVAAVGEYGPITTIRIDKQNRGRTGEIQQFYLGKRFELRDVQTQINDGS